MNLNQLTSEVLRSAIRAVETKEKLKAEVAEIDRQLAAILGDNEPATARETRKTARRIKRDRRGGLKAVIVPVLQKAGATGLSLNEISVQSGVGIRNLSAWLGRTAKKINGIKRLGRGRYTWKE